MDRREFLSGVGAAGLLGGVPFVPTGLAAPADDPPGNQRPPRPRALVIAVEQTDTVEVRTLDGVIDQASAFIEWLIKRAKVAPGDITFLASPESAPPVSGVKPAGPAHLAPIIHAVRNLVQSPQPEDVIAPGDRLFFFFSGHGTSSLNKENKPGGLLKTQWNNEADDGLVPANYDGEVTHPLSLNWVLDWFKTTGALEQFFFIDSCRTVGNGEQFAEGKPVREDPSAPSPNPFLAPMVHRFVCHAVRPGQKAFNAQGPKSFANALLQALDRGMGTAKRFVPNPPPGKYLVQWELIGKYLMWYFTKKAPLFDMNNLQNKIFLIPQFRCVDASGTPDEDVNPVLTELPPCTVARVKLRIRVEPAAAREVARLKLKGDGLPDRPLCFGRDKDVIEVDVMPRCYRLDIEAKDYVRVDNLPMAVYDDPTEPARIVLRKEKVAAFPFEKSREGGSVLIVGANPYEYLEVVDQFHRPLAHNGRPARALGKLKLDDLPAGEYHVSRPASSPSPFRETATLAAARALDTALDTMDKVEFHDVESPIGSRPWVQARAVENVGGAPPPEPFVVFPGTQHTVLAPGMSPSALPGGDRDGDDDDTGKEIVEGLRAPGSAGLIPLLARALRATRRKPAPELAEALPLRPLPTGETGFRVLIAVDGSSSRQGLDFLSKVHLEIAALDPRSEFAPVRDSDAVRRDVGSVGISSYLRTAPAGAYRLTLRTSVPGDRVSIALNLLPDRQHELLLCRTLDLGYQLAQFSPEAAGDKTPADAMVGLCQLQCDLIPQQTLRPIPASPLWPRAAEELLGDLRRGGTHDPFADAIGAYVAMRRRDVRSLLVRADDMIDRYPRLPDGYVARGVALEVDPNPKLRATASEAYREALRQGIPTLRPFLQALWGGTRRLKGLEGAPYSQDIARAVERNALSELWSIWADSSQTPS